MVKSPFFATLVSASGVAGSQVLSLVFGRFFAFLGSVGLGLLVVRFRLTLVAQKVVVPFLVD